MKRGGADFSGLCTPLGEEGARKVAHRLAGLSLPPEQYAELRRRQTAEVVADLRPVDEIRFAPMPNVNPESIRPIMDTEAGKPIDQTVLDRDIRRIYGTGNFEHVKYRFLEEPGRRVLVVDAVEKTWGFDALRFGLGLSCDFKGDAFFNLIGSYRKYWLNSPGGERRTDVQVGRSNAVSTELYQPLTARGTFFVAPNASWSRRTTDVYQQNDRVATYDNRSSPQGCRRATC